MAPSSLIFSFLFSLIKRCLIGPLQRGGTVRTILRLVSDLRSVRTPLLSGLIGPLQRAAPSRPFCGQSPIWGACGHLSGRCLIGPHDHTQLFTHRGACGSPKNLSKMLTSGHDFWWFLRDFWSKISQKCLPSDRVAQVEKTRPLF